MLKRNCYIIFTLLFCTFTAPTVNAAFDSQQQMYQKIHSAGFHYITEVPFSWNMRIRLLDEAGNYKSMGVSRAVEDFDIEYLPSLNYRIKPKKPPHLAFRVGETMVCYIEHYFSLMVGQYLQESSFNHCLIFPYKVSDVIKQMSKV